jgi:hypothetical protein
MLNADEAMANIRRDDERKTEHKHSPVGRTLDLLAQRVDLDEQLSTVKQNLVAAVGELQKLMSLDEFAHHAQLSKPEKALLQDLDQNPRAKARTHTPVTASAQQPSVRRNPAQRNSTHRHTDDQGHVEGHQQSGVTATETAHAGAARR